MQEPGHERVPEALLGGREEFGQGINSYQLVRIGGRRWIVSLIRDEDYAAGPVPKRYRVGR